MRRLTDGERDIVAEIERDARAGLSDADAAALLADDAGYRVWLDECDAVAAQQAWNAAHAGDLDEMPF